jgi:hypothetical protein
MKTYRITNTISGFKLGVFQANSESEALKTMYAEAGYPSKEAAEETVPTEPTELSVEEVKLHIMCQHFQHTTKYRRMYINGYQYCGYVKNQREYRSIVAHWENVDSETDENGKIYDDGQEIYDINHPDDYDFGDYRYFLVDELDEDYEEAPARYR